MRFYVYPYRLYSKSARLLAERLGSLRIRPDGRYRYRPGHAIVNWGNSTFPNWGTDEALLHTLNNPLAVRGAANKLLCLQTLYSAEIPTVPFTTNEDFANQNWDRYYARYKLTGHSGEGIFITDVLKNCNSPWYTYLMGALPPTRTTHAPLYTKAIENHGEYRVHVFRGEIIDYRKKSRSREDTPSEAQNAIRTLGNGWVYRMGHLRRLERIERLAIDSVEALGLDFGAVDIIKDENGRCLVLEVNCAPGPGPTTLDNYVNAIERYATG